MAFAIKVSIVSIVCDFLSTHCGLLSLIENSPRPRFIARKKNKALKIRFLEFSVSNRQAYEKLHQTSDRWS